MKYLSTIGIICFLTLSLAAQSKYESGMERAFGLYSEGKLPEAQAMFERISLAEPAQWLPSYHSANILIISAFGIADQAKREASLKKAKSIIEDAHLRDPNNSELVTLEGLLYTGYVAMQPEVYGMQYSNKIIELHKKAIVLNPENPRAHLNSAEYEFGMAQFFGNDTSHLCERMQEILPKFDKQADEVFAPSYGKERAEKFIQDCK